MTDRTRCIPAGTASPKPSQLHYVRSGQHLHVQLKNPAEPVICIPELPQRTRTLDAFQLEKTEALKICLALNLEWPNKCTKEPWALLAVGDSEDYGRDLGGWLPHI